MTGFDLIIFAALALFLGWKLYTVLGRRTGNERSIDPFVTKPGSAPNGTPNSDPAGRAPATGSAGERGCAAVAR